MRTLEELHDTFRKWLGDGYDNEAMTAVLAAAAVERLDGDPLWLFLISGSGNAKTEMVQPLTVVGGVLAGMSTDVPRPTGWEAERLLNAADLVTRARTAVDITTAATW